MKIKTYDIIFIALDTLCALRKGKSSICSVI